MRRTHVKSYAWVHIACPWYKFKSMPNPKHGVGELQIATLVFQVVERLVPNPRFNNGTATKMVESHQSIVIKSTQSPVIFCPYESQVLGWQQWVGLWEVGGKTSQCMTFLPLLSPPLVFCLAFLFCYQCPQTITQTKFNVIQYFHPGC